MHAVLAQSEELAIGSKMGTHSFTIRVSSRPVTRPCCNTEVVIASFVPTCKGDQCEQSAPRS